MSGSETDKLLNIYTTGLRNQHAVEKQAVELLERQVGRLENYPEMADRMRQHITESQEQARRIEELLSHFATSHSSIKDAMMGLVGNMAAMTHAATQDEVMKNTFANFAFEHFEIASYTSLLTLADLAGHGAAQSALQQSLNEEKDMAVWIADHLTPTTRRYAELYVSGQTAGV